MKYIITSLITAFIVLLFAIKIFPKDDDTEIKQLKTYNDSLRLLNNKYKYQIEYNMLDIYKQDSLIKKLYYKQKKIYYIIDSLNNQITIINDKYAKANHYSDSLNIFQLKRYFSELK
jgi:peptidoglycan hydrolase CwlO-like protein